MLAVRPAFLVSAYDTKAPDASGLDVSGCDRAADETATNARSIYTAVDLNTSSTLTSADQVDFSLASLTAHPQLVTALNVGGNATLAQNLVKFVRGFDVSDVDLDGNRTEERNLSNIQDASGNAVEGWWKLGDTFHSIPNIVERPEGRGMGGWGSTLSYKEFAKDYDTRDRVIVVGANDGMLHAFRTGTWNSTDKRYDTINSAAGGGEELWGFVSPEMLPKLKDTCNPSLTGCTLGDYSFKVDGSVMVRDVWFGSASDNFELATNKTKWHTMAVYGHRQGGTTYVALDVTDIDSPTVLWQFPQANTRTADGTLVSSLMAQSWLDVFPAPASIGPMRFTEADGSTSFKWVVLLSAGYDPTDTKGRALFIVDATSGALLWTSRHATNSDMKYSFPGTPAFYANYGAAQSYIDGIVAVDHGGQVWHVKTLPAILSGGVITNFTPEIVFRTVASPISPDPETNRDGVVVGSEYQTHPFFFIPTLTYNHGKIRAILGTGDRDMLVPPAGINADVATALCSEVQRLYAFDVEPCDNGSGGTRPCTENDLTEVSDSDSTYALASSKGWYMQLEAGEKVATPYEIVGGYALYATFMPAASVGSGGADVCSTDSKGEARLYARHYLTGKVLDWDNDGLITDEASYVDMGAGVPTAPSVSTAIAGGTTTSTIFAGASDSGLISRSFSAGSGGLAGEIMLFPVSRELHEVVHHGK